MSICSTVGTVAQHSVTHFGVVVALSTCLQYFWYYLTLVSTLCKLVRLPWSPFIILISLINYFSLLSGSENRKNWMFYMKLSTMIKYLTVKWNSALHKWILSTSWLLSRCLCVPIVCSQVISLYNWLWLTCSFFQLLSLHLLDQSYVLLRLSHKLKGDKLILQSKVAYCTV